MRELGQNAEITGILTDFAAERASKLLTPLVRPVLARDLLLRPDALHASPAAT